MFLSLDVCAGAVLCRHPSATIPLSSTMFEGLVCLVSHSLDHTGLGTRGIVDGLLSSFVASVW